MTYMSVMVPRDYSEQLCIFLGNRFRCNFSTKDFGANHSQIFCDSPERIRERQQQFDDIIGGFHCGWEIGKSSE